ncbi:hypothetical protein Q8W71_28320 [Methylobacterium sp. NEAU 140]|uniref:hypothetical protein n=1 Tax=Methylobacterium sp. NEAU 140 TaxID=3064945 RepID=UPI0027354845|nr:hypothetical protein [Methylobacterium sp. NEAU 140]MDP4026527.1 hypothetical protein [Methylobacterium sp. NEAU 140]
MGESADRVKRVIKAVEASVPPAAGRQVAPSWCSANMQPIRNLMLGVGAQLASAKSPASVTVVEFHEHMGSREETYRLHNAAGEHATVLFRFMLGPAATPLAHFEGLDEEAQDALAALKNPDGAMEGYLRPRAIDVLEGYLVRFLSKGTAR